MEKKTLWQTAQTEDSLEATCCLWAQESTCVAWLSHQAMWQRLGNITMCLTYKALNERWLLLVRTKLLASTWRLGLCLHSESCKADPECYADL